jgi:hypothetical protein
MGTMLFAVIAKGSAPIFGAKVFAIMEMPGLAARAWAASPGRRYRPGWRGGRRRPAAPGRRLAPGRRPAPGSGPVRTDRHGGYHPFPNRRVMARHAHHITWCVAGVLGREQIAGGNQ